MTDYGKRWQIYSWITECGFQYSVFECLVDAKTLDKIIVMLSPFTEGNDSIRFYQICEACLKKMVLQGSGKVTEEVMFHLV